MKTPRNIFGLSVALLAVVLVAAPASAERQSAVRDRHAHHDGHHGRSQDRGHRSDGRHGSRDKQFILSFGSHRRVPHRVIYTRRVYVPGYHEKRWIEPIYETRYDSCGRAYEVLIREGCYERIWVPGHYETRTKYRYNGYDRRSYGHHGHYRNRHRSRSGVHIRF